MCHCLCVRNHCGRSWPLPLLPLVYTLLSFPAPVARSFEFIYYAIFHLTFLFVILSAEPGSRASAQLFTDSRTEPGK